MKFHPALDPEHAATTQYRLKNHARVVKHVKEKGYYPFKKKKGMVAEIELACRSIELVTSSSSNTAKGSLLTGSMVFTLDMRSLHGCDAAITF
ncbi:hypothetical protein VNO80_11960 [Phaseolus coccineus]|uniref:Uncharacterized protein n=1 Tax=Phaseolus coccineus TaxID=3886 RepID=A0AAN9NBC8_PHACN